jgi:hypothetical protein
MVSTIDGGHYRGYEDGEYLVTISYEDADGLAELFSTRFRKTAYAQ